MKSKPLLPDTSIFILFFSWTKLFKQIIHTLCLSFLPHTGSSTSLSEHEVQWFALLCLYWHLTTTNMTSSLSSLFPWLLWDHLICFPSPVSDFFLSLILYALSFSQNSPFSLFRPPQGHCSWRSLCPQYSFLHPSRLNTWSSSWPHILEQSLPPFLLILPTYVHHNYPFYT